MKRMVHFLKAQGFRQEFEEQEQELRDCLVQLSAILNMAHFTSQVGAAAGRGTRSQLAPCGFMHAPHPSRSDVEIICGWGTTRLNAEFRVAQTTT
jgi:hypothetical protein